MEVYFINGMNEQILIEDIPKVSDYVDYSKFLPIRETSRHVQYELIRKQAISFIKKRRIQASRCPSFLSGFSIKK